LTLRAAAALWGLDAALFLLAFIYSLFGRGDPGVLILTGAFSFSGAWLAVRLWRSPTRTIIVISACVGAFIALGGVVALVGSSTTAGTPWGIALLLMGGLAGSLPMLSWRELPAL
jgi:hypothetical protein